MIALLLLLLAAPQDKPTLIVPEEIYADTGYTLRLQGKSASGVGVEITATYRPNAHESIRHSNVIGTTDGNGNLSWTPEESGIVVPSWKGGEKAVSVRNRTTPLSGVIIMIFAGIVLIGGMLRYFIQMMRQPG